MDLRLTSNAAVAPKDCNPNGLFRFGRMALLLLGHGALRLCSLVAPRQAAKADTARTTPIYEMGSGLASALGLRRLLGGRAAFCRQRFLVRRMEVEINAAERAVLGGLTEDDGDLLVERNAVAQIRPARFISLDGFVHQRNERFFKPVRSLIQANDEFLVSFDRFRQLVLECFDSHAVRISRNGGEMK